MAVGVPGTVAEAEVRVVYCCGGIGLAFAEFEGVSGEWIAGGVRHARG
jgi:hypothetical protein